MTNNGKHTILGQLAPVGLFVACLFVSACSSLPKGELAPDLGIKDRGVASWYGGAFHGKLAANGEVFDKTAYTAAHRKLPLGSIVRVMNLHTGKVVQVRITDRGPYVRGRMLDLSEAAAQELGLVKAGLAAVQLEVIGKHQLIPPLPKSHHALPLAVRGGSDAATPKGLAEGLESPAVHARMMPQDVW